MFFAAYILDEIAEVLRVPARKKYMLNSVIFVRIICTTECISSLLAPRLDSLNNKDVTSLNV